MDKKVKIVIKIVVAVALIAGAFYGGMLYKASQTPARSATAFGSRTGGVRFASGANFVIGDVVAMDSQSITVKSADGSSKIILYSPSTEVTKYVSDTIGDVNIGATVMVNGTTNTDGSIGATSIQIRPSMNRNSSVTAGQ